MQKFRSRARAQLRDVAVELVSQCFRPEPRVIISFVSLAAPHGDATTGESAFLHRLTQRKKCLTIAETDHCNQPRLCVRDDVVQKRQVRRALATKVKLRLKSKQTWKLLEHQNAPAPRDEKPGPRRSCALSFLAQRGLVGATRMREKIIETDLPSRNFQPLVYGVGAWTSHLHFAYDLVALLQPRLVVELGVDRGESFFAFCQSAAENKTRT